MKSATLDSIVVALDWLVFFLNAKQHPPLRVLGFSFESQHVHRAIIVCEVPPPLLRG